MERLCNLARLQRREHSRHVFAVLAFPRSKKIEGSKDISTICGISQKYMGVPLARGLDCRLLLRESRQHLDFVNFRVRNCFTPKGLSVRDLRLLGAFSNHEFRDTLSYLPKTLVNSGIIESQ